MTESATRIDRIKKILGLEEDKDLADFCKTQHPRISAWRHKGFHKTTERIIDGLLDRYETDISPNRVRRKQNK